VSLVSGKSIPVTPLDKPYDNDYTPMEKDEHEGRLVPV
jgi:hypothetical protein